MKKIIIILGCIILGCYIFNMLISDDSDSLKTLQKNVMQTQIDNYREHY